MAESLTVISGEHIHAIDPHNCADSGRIGIREYTMGDEHRWMTIAHAAARGHRRRNARRGPRRGHGEDIDQRRLNRWHKTRFGIKSSN
jgi:hypothetical protein